MFYLALAITIFECLLAAIAVLNSVVNHSVDYKVIMSHFVIVSLLVTATVYLGN